MHPLNHFTRPNFDKLETHSRHIRDFLSNHFLFPKTNKALKNTFLPHICVSKLVGTILLSYTFHCTGLKVIKPAYAFRQANLVNSTAKLILIEQLWSINNMSSNLRKVVQISCIMYLLLHRTA